MHPREIRSSFLKYFEDHGHRIVPSFTALAEQVSADMILERLVTAVPVPHMAGVEVPA